MDNFGPRPPQNARVKKFSKRFWIGIVFYPSNIIWPRIAEEHLNVVEPRMITAWIPWKQMRSAARKLGEKPIVTNGRTT